MADTNYAVNSGFYDSINEDRLYSADDMNRPYKRIVTDGVFATPNGTASTDLQVMARSGMNVVVSQGEGMVGNKWFENPDELVITLSANNNITPRIDSIVAQVDLRTSGRTGSIVYRTGTASSNPVAPAINTVEDVVELRLANILVNPNTSRITQSMITDTRGSADCQWITSLIQQVDTSTLYAQWNDAYQQYYDNETESFNAFMETLTSQLTVNTNLVKYESHYVTVQDNVTVIPINISPYRKNKDVLLVNINGLLASELTDYTVATDSSTITLNKALPSGQNVDFIVLKSVVVGDLDTLAQSISDLQNTVNKVRVVATNGGVKLSITDTNTNVLTAFTNLGMGFHTIYAAYNTQGLPVVGAYRLFGHLTGANYGWLIAIKADGSIYENYLDNGTWQGWRTLFDKTPTPLYQSTNGTFPNNDVVITPTKTLSQCQHGWELVFTGYDDTNSTGRDQYMQTVTIPKRSYKAATWNGETTTFQLVYGYTQASSAIQSCIKSFQVYDDSIVSTVFNSQGTSRNMVLRAIYEY